MRIFLVLFISFNYQFAFATSTGQTGYSNETSGTNCFTSGCHDANAYNYSGNIYRDTGTSWLTSSPTIDNTDNVDLMFFLNKSSGSNGVRFGFNMSTSSGTLSDTSSRTQVSGDELTHDGKQSTFCYTDSPSGCSTTDGDAQFSLLNWAPPSTIRSEDQTIYACGNVVNNDLNSTDDGLSTSEGCDTMTVNIRPRVSGWVGGLTYTEGTTSQVIDSSVIVYAGNYSDSGDDVISGTVSITNAQANDSLYCNSTITTSIKTINTISCSGSGTTTLTLSGSATYAEYDGLIQGIRFRNISQDPVSGTRNISLQLRDDDFDDSISDTATVIVSAVNDVPTTSGWSGTNNYTEGDGYITIDNTVSLSDVDSSNLNRALVELTNPQTNDEIACPSSATSGITCTPTGVTLLTFTGNTTVANYELAVEGARFRNTSSNPNVTPRDITLEIRDSSNASSAVATKEINVISISDPPVVNNFGDTMSDNISFTEDAIIGTLIDSNVTVTDVDSTNCNQAIVEVFNNQSDQDVLDYTGSVTGITDSFNATTGTLTLSGTATCTNYGLALQTVRYSNTSQNPNTDNRTLTVSARDDGNTTSSLASKTIFVIATNDNPVAVDDTFTVADSSTDNQLDVIGTAGGGQDSDPENDSLSINSVSPSSLGATITIGGNCSANTICYTPSANFITVDSFTYTLSDGNGGTSNSATVTISPPDTDNDGVAQAIDNCPSVSNADQLDSNSDGKGDACETDLDEDGVFDSGLQFTVTQDGMQGLTAFQDIVDSIVSIQVDFIDSQLDLRNIVYDWSASDNEIFSILSVNNSRAEFDAADSQLDAGVYKLAVTLSEGNLSITDSVFINVIANTPAFFDCDGDGIDDGISEGNSGDCDGDGITNIAESYGDSDYNGIPDYLDDNNLTSNIAYDQYNDLNASFEISTNDGLTLRKGETATYANHSGLGISIEDIENFGGNGGSAVTTSDDEFDHIGGIFSFEISGVTPGDSADIIIPLTTQLPPNALYRKFIDGNWTGFVTDANNQVMSAPYQTTIGICPPIDHSSYSSGLNAFDACLQLTIEDGGPNDTDNLANGVIRDPSGPAIATNGASGDNLDEVKGGGRIGIIETILLLLLLTYLGYYHKEKNNLIRGM